MHFDIVSDSINISTLMADLEDPTVGAVATFEGRVRNHHNSLAVSSLEYQAYIPLAITEGQRILSQAYDRYEIVTASCVHRVGHLSVGELAVWVGVTAAHRRDAFSACQFIIDQVKSRVPIWKKEHYPKKQSTWLSNVEELTQH